MLTTGARRAPPPMLPRMMIPSGVISRPVNDTTAERSKSFNASSSLPIASVKALLMEGVCAARALSIWDLMALTAVACGMNHDSSTSGSPTRTGVIVWLDGSSRKVNNCLNWIHPLGAELLVSAATRAKISIPPALNVNVGPRVKRRRYVADTDMKKRLSVSVTSLLVIAPISMRPRTYSWLTAKAKPLVPMNEWVIGPTPLAGAPAPGVSWNGSAMTWPELDPRPLNAANGKSSTGSTIKPSRRSFRICTASVFSSAALSPLPGAALNRILASSDEGEMCSLVPEPDGSMRTSKAAFTSPWIGAGRSTVSGSGEYWARMPALTVTSDDEPAGTLIVGEATWSLTVPRNTPGVVSGLQRS